MAELKLEVSGVRTRFDAALASAQDADAFEAVRVRFLGRHGEITRLRRSIGTLPSSERPGAGQTINDEVAAMEGALAQAHAALEQRDFEEQLRARIDVTFPAPERALGSIHPLRRVTDGTENTMPAIIEAVKAYATLGEIMDVFRSVFGDYMEPAVF